MAKIQRSTQKITPFLWFNDNAEAAMNFYTSVFRDSRIKRTSRYGEGGPGPAGTLMVGTFEIAGQEFMAMNGGPQFTFSPAISMLVNCDTQEEIDFLWEKLSAGGEIQQCGWLRDKFGLSWQIVPTILGEFMTDSDPAKTGRVMGALMQMIKIEIRGLEEAYKG
jgi:predicted 3-demethylubiquinone-9 3-methyltransferase (glyoxalase superfamily)